MEKARHSVSDEAVELYRQVGLAADCVERTRGLARLGARQVFFRHSSPTISRPS